MSPPICTEATRDASCANIVMLADPSPGRGLALDHALRTDDPAVPRPDPAAVLQHITLHHQHHKHAADESNKSQLRPAKSQLKSQLKSQRTVSLTELPSASVRGISKNS